MIPFIIAAMIIIEVAGIGITAYSVYDGQKVQQAILESNDKVMDAISNMPPQMETVYYSFRYGLDFWSMLAECWVQIWLIVAVMFIAYMIVHPRKARDGSVPCGRR